MRIYCCTLLWLAWVLSPTFAQDAKQMSLQEAVEYAMEHDVSLENARLNITDANEQIIERRAIGLPQITGSVGYQYYLKVPATVLPSDFSPNGERQKVEFALRNNFNLGAELNTLIFDGSYLVGLKAARLYRSYVDQELLTAQQSVKNKVTQAYLPVLMLEENLEILSKNIGNLEKLLNETRQTYEAGFVEQLDVDRLDLSLANLNVEKENLERQKKIVLNALKFTIGYPIDEPLAVNDNINTLLTEATNDELEGAINYYERAEYRVAEKGVELNELNVKLFQAGYLPTLSASANYQYGYQGDKLFHKEGFWVPTSVLGVRLGIPLFDGFNKKAKVQRARVGLAIAQNQKAELERAIRLQVENARTNYLNAKRRVTSQEKNLQLAERIYDTTQIKYREGVGSSLEVTQAEQSLYTSQQNYTQALFELLVAKAELYEALGK